MNAANIERGELTSVIHSGLQAGGTRPFRCEAVSTAFVVVPGQSPGSTESRPTNISFCGEVTYRKRASMTEDDFQYAIENTRVILAPERQIASFGSTSFRFYLISELMDRVNEVRVRDGRIHADRPQILTPEHYCRLLLEGFGEKAQKYVDQLREHTRDVAVLRYGFQFRKTDVTENTVRDTMDAVIARTKLKVEHSDEPLSAVIQGVDDAWEVCLLKFTIDLIERSTGGNMGDFRRRGLV